MIRSIGFPRTDFLLYADDSEFTYRISRNGERLFLVTAATLDDIQSSSNAKIGFGNAFVAILKGFDDFRAYYSVRNGVYLDTVSVKHNTLIFSTNRITYMLLLFLYSVFLRKRQRYRLLCKAIHDGLSSTLGVNDNFPL